MLQLCSWVASIVLWMALVGSLVGAVGRGDNSIITTASTNSQNKDDLTRMRREAIHRMITPNMCIEEAKIVHQRAMFEVERHATSHGHFFSQQGGRNALMPSTPTLLSPSPSLGSSVGDNSGGHEINPVEFGADPTGEKDSTAAFQACVAAMLNRTNKSNVTMAINIFDLGGVTLNLHGGQYLISQPIVIPPYFGNAHIVQGTLRASKSFPSDRYLIEIGDSTCEGGGQGSCNEFINIRDMMLDASHTSAGGVHITSTMGVTIGPAFFIGYLVNGILVSGGHETMIFNSWLAEFYWSSTSKQGTSVGIRLDGNDHYVTNTILFDWSSVGVMMTGAANILTGVHTWNGGGIGVINASNRNRMVSCYLDYNYLELQYASQFTITNSFFLSTRLVINDTSSNIDGLIVLGNTFADSNPIVVVGNYNVTNVDFRDNLNCPKNTVSTKSLSLTNAATFSFDFSDALLFSTISRATYTVTSSNGGAFQPSYLEMPGGTHCMVQFSNPVNATVFVTAYN
eukprot:m.46832 g.46832  ORF g.46832 m.46832 type:complete len:512 (+) comp7289_c0_seq1:185-1720(+)